MLYYVMLYCIMLCYVMLCYVMLYYIILYYIILYYIILYSSKMSWNEVRRANLVKPNTCSSITILSPEIYTCFLNFWKICTLQKTQQPHFTHRMYFLRGFCVTITKQTVPQR